MEWILENWMYLVLFVCVAVMLVGKYIIMAELPSAEKEAMVREWLLWAVTMAEKELGAGTGALKLRFVYDRFVVAFPWMVAYVPFDVFGSWVDEALENMKTLLKNNEQVATLIQ